MIRAAALALFLVPALALAGPSYAGCFARVGAYYRIAPKLLAAIASHESSDRARAVHHNANGSADYGLMQINSLWLPTLAKLGISKADLLDKPCLNVAVGAAILDGDFQRYGVTWKAVGAYNASSPDKRKRYALAIERELKGDDGWK